MSPNNAFRGNYMANEITASMVLKLLKGNTSVDLALAGATFNQNGTRYTRHRKTIGTTEEIINLGETPLNGFFLIINRDETNFVSVRATTGGNNLFRLRAKGGFLFGQCTTSMEFYMIADTASCDVEYLFLEL